MNNDANIIASSTRAGILLQRSRSVQQKKEKYLVKPARWATPRRDIDNKDCRFSAILYVKGSENKR
jgi:hypothetical protein